MKIKLNLIPPQKKEAIKRAHWLRLVSKWEIEFVLLLVFFIAVLVSMNLILKVNMEMEANDTSLAEKNNYKYNQIKEYDSEIVDVNKQIVNVRNLQANQLYWSNLLLKLNSKVVNGIEIVSLVTKEYDLILNGKADTRDNLIIFKDSLVQDDCFSGVDLPLSNLVSKDNVEFQISFSIKKECLNSAIK